MRALKKLRSRSGESLVEVLASILILTMSMMILATSMSSAGKITSLIDLEGTAFALHGSTPMEAEVTLQDYEIGGLNGFVTENGYYYYE